MDIIGSDGDHIARVFSNASICVTASERARMIIRDTTRYQTWEDAQYTKGA